jgi:hypothetical protein
MEDAADAQAEHFIDCAHPFAIASSEVIVDGDDMNAPTGKGVEIDG